MAPLCQTYSPSLRVFAFLVAFSASPGGTSALGVS